MEKAPSFQFYAQDFLTGVMYLTNEEIGIYIKMIAKQWTDGRIPKKRLGFLVGFDWNELSDELKGKFTDMGEYVVNQRLEKERDKKERFLEKQSINGKLGGRPSKKELDNKPKPNPNLTQKKPLEEEEEDIDKYKSENQFLNDWKKVRERVLNKATNINKLTTDEERNFSDLKKEFTIDQFRQSIQGLFMQKEMFESNRLRPKHFLSDRNIEKYLDAYKNKTQLFENKTAKL